MLTTDARNVEVGAEMAEDWQNALLLRYVWCSVRKGVKSLLNQ